MPTERKVAQVAELRELIRDAQIAISTAYQGISVSDQVELRRQLNAAGAEMRVVKNTLLRIAAKDEGLDVFGELAQGATALVLSRDDIVAPARALSGYLRENPTSPVEVRSAVVEGELVDAAYVRGGSLNVSSTFEIDNTIDPAETRKLVVAAFKLLRSKREELPKRKHGNVPL